MLERSEASKMVVLVITIVKEILDFSVDRWFALLRMTGSRRIIIVLSCWSEAKHLNRRTEEILDFSPSGRRLLVHYVQDDKVYEDDKAARE